MTNVCPRCATANSRWERRCIACWLIFDPALLATHRSDLIGTVDEPGSISNDAPAHDVANGAPVDDAESAEAAAEHERHKTLAALLGVEVQHVRALADAGIHTLEHIAESSPHQIAHALRDWTHIDPGALIARARKLLRREPIPAPEPPPQPEPQPPVEPLPKKPLEEPDPAEWWKIT